MTLSSIIITSPLGDIYAIASDEYLLMTEFADNAELSEKIRKIEKRYNTNIKSQGNLILSQVALELREYFTGTRRNFMIPLDPRGTEFQMKAWKSLEKIPYGETRNYLEEATIIGNSKALRAIGGANHHNPIVIIIPCHRVIWKSGKLVGYGGWLTRKIWLLKHEQKYK